MAAILVSGATGYLGGRLVPLLAREQDEVHAIVQATSDTTQLAATCPQVRIWRCGPEYDDVAQIVNDIKPAVIYHLATLFVSQHQPSQINAMIDAIIRFGTHLADAAATLERCLFINVSTTWQHHNDAAYDPTSLYAGMKQAFEDILYFYAASKRLTVTTLVLGDTYGPGDPRPKILTLFRRYAESGDALMMTEGLQRLDLVHADDAVRALLHSPSVEQQTGRAASRFMVRTGVSHSVREIAALYESVFNVRLNITWGAVPYHPRVMMQSPSIGEVLPGWHPQFSLAEGLKTLERPRV